MQNIVHRIPGLVITDHEFTVPLDHSKPDGEAITVFGREIVAPDKEHDDLPWLLFLQGGPGFGSPRPTERSGWLKRALHPGAVSDSNWFRKSPGSGGLFEAFSCGSYRAGRGVDSALTGGGRSALERLGSKLRRLLCSALSIGGSRRLAGSDIHRRFTPLRTLPR